jgi:hypothetical protein
MVQLLRLRQCTSHPFMLERTIKDCWTLEDVDEMKSKMKRLRTISKPFYEQCRIVCALALSNLPLHVTYLNYLKFRSFTN